MTIEILSLIQERYLYLRIIFAGIRNVNRRRRDKYRGCPRFIAVSPSRAIHDRVLRVRLSHIRCNKSAPAFFKCGFTSRLT